VRWHQLSGGIPKDVATVIVQQGDPLDLRIHENPALTRDLAAEFSQEFSAATIKVYERRSKIENEK